MADLTGFNANNVAPLAPREVLPAGPYVAVITASEMKSNRANTGSYLELTFEIVAGPYAGRSLKARLNLDNPSAQAVAIAQAELSAICHAVGVTEPRDSADLHHLPLGITVKVVKRQDNGEPGNEITGYRRRDAKPAPAPTPAPATPPWKRP